MFKTVEICGYPVCWNAIISAISVVGVILLFFIGAYRLERRNTNGRSN